MQSSSVLPHLHPGIGGKTIDFAGCGYVKGVVRRFAQSSLDHRGTPEKPGRVVTVIDAGDWHRLAVETPISQDEDIVWGVAYRIEESREEEVRAYLEHREKNGYTAHDVPVYTRISGAEAEERVIVDSASIWIGRLDNPAFVGYEPLEYLSRRIYECHGPSGPNREYVYKLSEAVRDLYPSVKDDYLFELEAAVKRHDPEWIQSTPMKQSKAEVRGAQYTTGRVGQGEAKR